MAILFRELEPLAFYVLGTTLTDIGLIRSIVPSSFFSPVLAFVPCVG